MLYRRYPPRCYRRDRSWDRPCLAGIPNPGRRHRPPASAPTETSTSQWVSSDILTDVFGW